MGLVSKPELQFRDQICIQFNQLQLRDKYDSGELFSVPGDYGPMVLRRRFIEEGNRANFLKQKEDAIDISCPMILLHCTADNVAPYEVR